MDDVGTQTDTEIEKDDSGLAFVVETKRIRGTFSELLELKHFPFDIQVIVLKSMLYYLCFSFSRPSYSIGVMCMHVYYFSLIN